jgi:hypothetical protein
MKTHPEDQSEPKIAVVRVTSSAKDIAETSDSVSGEVKSILSEKSKPEKLLEIFENIWNRITDLKAEVESLYSINELNPAILENFEDLLIKINKMAQDLYGTHSLCSSEDLGNDFIEYT